MTFQGCSVPFHEQVQCERDAAETLELLQFFPTDPHGGQFLRKTHESEVLPSGRRSVLEQIPPVTQTSGGAYRLGSGIRRCSKRLLTHVLSAITSPVFFQIAALDCDFDFLLGGTPGADMTEGASQREKTELLHEDRNSAGVECECLGEQPVRILMTLPPDRWCGTR